jgi:hypothetical protein
MNQSFKSFDDQQASSPQSKTALDHLANSAHLQKDSATAADFKITTEFAHDNSFSNQHAESKRGNETERAPRPNEPFGKLSNM